MYGEREEERHRGGACSLQCYLINFIKLFSDLQCMHMCEEKREEAQRGACSLKCSLINFVKLINDLQCMQICGMKQWRERERDGTGGACCL